MWVKFALLMTWLTWHTFEREHCNLTRFIVLKTIDVCVAEIISSRAINSDEFDIQSTEAIWQSIQHGYMIPKHDELDFLLHQICDVRTE